MGGDKFCFKNPKRNVTFCSPIKFLRSLPQDVMQKFSNLCIVRDEVMIAVRESNELFHFFTVVQSRVSSGSSQLVTIRFNFFGGYHMTKVSDLLLGKMTFFGFQFQIRCSETVEYRKSYCIWFSKVVLNITIASK